LSTLTILDFDDTLAQTEVHIAPPIKDLLYQILKAETGLSREEFIQRSRELSALHGSSIHGWAKLLNKSESWVLTTYAELAPHLVGYAQVHIAADEVLNTKLRLLQKRGHILAILSHGHRDYILPLMRHLGLLDIIPEHHVFDISSTAGILKRSEHSYRYVLNSMADHAFLAHNMVEDYPANLVAAKTLGFSTWLVGARAPSPEETPYIDYRKPTLHDVLDDMLRVPESSSILAG
jgi:FMN phosphatase YigB (HAD superfamily)